MRFYKENLGFTQLEHDLMRIPITELPVGMANFPEEQIFPTFPKAIAETKFRHIVTFTDMEAGGHFAAWEEPKLLARELFKFVSDAEKWWLNKAKSKSEL